MRSNTFFVILLVLVLMACNNQKQLIYQSISEDTESIIEEVVRIRRHFHQFPELAGNETQTKKYIESYLSDLGIEILPNVYANGVVGVLNKGKAGKKIGWRADMDALPNHFPDPVEFKSVFEGVQHGCGHDVHMAIGLGIANILSKRKNQIEGQVYFIFQPEEETFIGAKSMIDNGVVADLELDEIYALHVTDLPVGRIMVKSNELYAYQKRVRISFDQLIAASDLEDFFQELRASVVRVEEGSQPWNLQYAFDENLGLHNENTIFSDYRIMDENPIVEFEEGRTNILCYLYETDSSRLSQITPEINAFIKQSRHSKFFISTTFIQENPTVINNEKLTKSAMKIIADNFGDTSIVLSYGQIPYFNDDFYYFQDKIDGVYFLLGGSNPSKGIIAMNHAPNFQVDEWSMKTGIEVFSTLIIERMNE